MSGRPRQKRPRQQDDPLDKLRAMAAEYGVDVPPQSAAASADDPLSGLKKLAQQNGVDTSIADPKPSTLRLPGAVVMAEDPAVARHRERYGEAPATVIRDSDDGATVTVGRPVGVGTPKSEIDRLVRDPSLATRIDARMSLLSTPPGYRNAPKVGKASTLANIALSNTISPISPAAADYATQVALDRYAEGGGDVGEIATPAAALAAAGDVAGNVGMSAVPLVPTIPGRLATKAARTVATRSAQGATENAAGSAFGAGVIEGQDAEEIGRRTLEGAAFGATLGGLFAMLSPAGRRLWVEMRGEKLSDMEIKTDILPRLSAEDRAVVERGLSSTDAPFAASAEDLAARRTTAQRADVSDMEIPLGSKMTDEEWLASAPGEAGVTVAPVGVKRRRGKIGTKEADEDGAKRFVEARTAGGVRRPIGSVSVNGLLRDLLDIEERRASAELRSSYRTTMDDNLHSTEDGRLVIAATYKGGGASEQAKALQNLEDYQRITREIYDELARRGVDDRSAFERMEEMRAERQGMETDAPARSTGEDDFVRDEQGNVLFSPDDIEPSTLRAHRESDRPDVQLSPDERVRGRPPRDAGITLDIERLDVAAIRLPDGQIVEGASGIDALRKAVQAGFEIPADWKALQEGWVTSTGRFVSAYSREAARIALRAGQLKRNSRLYKHLSQGVQPLRTETFPGQLRMETTRPAQPVKVEAESPIASLYTKRDVPDSGEGEPYIVDRSLLTNPTPDNPKGRWRLEKFADADDGPYLHDFAIEGYRLSDDSFISRAEAQERFGDALIGWEGRDIDTGGALFDPEPGGRERVSAAAVRVENRIFQGSPDRESGNLFGDDPLSGLKRLADEHGATQESLFGSKEGTAASRPLSAAEGAARSRLEKLRQQQKLTKSLDERLKLSREIADLERLVNRDKAIGADEMAARASAERRPGDEPDAPPDQGVLLAPQVHQRKGGQKQPGVPVPPPPTPLQRMVAAVAHGVGKVTARLGKKQLDEVKNLRRVNLELAEAIGVPVYQGRGNLKRMGAHGAYWLHSKVIRLKRMGRVSTFSHETLHYLDDKLGLRAMIRAGYDQKTRVAVRNELIQLGKDLYGNRRPRGGYEAEGVAEFGKFAVTDPAWLQQRAPNVARVLPELLEKTPELKAALDQARADYLRFKAAPAEAKIQAMIQTSLPARFNLSVRELVRQMFDDLEPIKHAVEEVLGAPKNATENAYVKARLTKGNAGRSQDMIQRGAVDFRTKKRLTRGLPAILEDIGERGLGPFVRYWTSEQVMTKSAQGIDTGFDVDAARETVRLGRQNPRYVKAAKELWAFRSALLQYMEDAGLPVSAKAIRDNNPTPTPFYRHFDPDEITAGKGKQMARNRAPVYQLTGSDRPILPPLESLLSDAYRMVDIAHRHHAAQVLIKHALATPGGGKVAELLPEVPMEVRRIAMSRVQQQLIDAGWTPPQQQAGSGLGPSPLDVLIAFYEKKQAGIGEIVDQVMPVSIDGQLRWVQIHDRTLFDALQSMNVQELEGWMRLVSLPTRLLRMGATQRNPDFLLVNPSRDAFQAAVYTQGPTHLPGYHIGRGIFHWARERFGDGDEYFQRWAQEGGESASLVGADRRLVREAYEKTVADLTAHGARWWVRQLTHPFRAASMMFEAMENATRLGEFAEVRDRAMKGGVPEMEASTRGAMAARDVTLDFFKSGEFSRKYNRITAFFVAHLNDIEKLAKEFNPANLLDTPDTRARYLKVNARALAFITMPSVALYLLNREDETFQELPEYWKATSWVFIDNDNGPVPYTTKSGKKVRVWILPRPHLLGYLFGYVPEKTLEWLDRNDPGALKEMAKQAWTALLPASMVIPTLAVPLAENYANKSLHSGRPIVPESATGLDPVEQASRRTGETARTIGGAVGYSPGKLENVLRGYTGGLGMLAADVTDVAMKKGKEKMGLPVLSPPPVPTDDPLESIPVLRRFLVPTPGGNAKSIERVIGDFEEAEQKRRTWRRLLAINPIRATAYFKEHEKAIRSVMTQQEAGRPGSLRAAHSQIMALKRDTRGILESRLSPERQADELQRNADNQIRAARRQRGLP